MRSGTGTGSVLGAIAVAMAVALSLVAAHGITGGPKASAKVGQEIVPPAPKPAQRPRRATESEAKAERQRRLRAVTSWGYQLANLDIPKAIRAPFDLLVVDATVGLAADRHMTSSEIASLKIKPDSSRRLVVSYLSIGEAEDYRPEYFSSEYMSEDAPDWLLHENPRWKGNRIIRFCREGWQQTMLGDENGRSVYNSIEPSPLYRLVELGLDGVYLDRVDVYREVAKDCPDAERRMVDFVVRLASHARRRNPHFLVIMQNAEDLLVHPRLVAAIDAVAKEDLFYGVDYSQRLNDPVITRESLAHLKRAQAAGLPIFVVDYVRDRQRIADAKRRILEQGFIPYIGPRNLDALWLPGTNF